LPEVSWLFFKAVRAGLAVKREDSGPFSGMGWGYTGVFATKNGGGFLTERFPDADKVIWDFRGDVATSRHIPEVSYVGIHHPGLMGPHRRPNCSQSGRSAKPT
jgi:acetamidase/formamidase